MAHGKGGMVIQGSFPHGVPRSLTAPHARLQSLPLPAHGGQPLPAQVRQAMESVFGVSFAAVRVHVDAHPRAIGAVAFTQGTDIHFAPGHYDPASVQGRRVLARELTHVVQQRAGRVRNPHGSGVAVITDQALEAEAERMSHRAAAVRLPAETAPVQRKAMHGAVVQMWPGPLTQMQAKGYLDEAIDDVCRANASPFPADLLKDRLFDGYKAMVVRLYGTAGNEETWFNEKAAKIYARTIVTEYAQLPRRLSPEVARAVINEEIRAYVHKHILHPSLADSLRSSDDKEYKAMVAVLRGTDGAPKVWKSYKEAQQHARSTKLVAKYVDAAEPSPAAWPRPLSELEAVTLVHKMIKNDLKERKDNKEGYDIKEESRIQGKKGEGFKEFKEMVARVRGPAGNVTWRSEADARFYLDVLGLVPAFISRELRVPMIPLSVRTTFDGKAYTQRHLFVEAVKAKHVSVDDESLRRALNRMDGNNDVSGNADLKRCNAGLAAKNTVAEELLQSGSHASFGRGPGGCTFFFRSHGGGHEILAIGYHVQNSSNYEIIWAFQAALCGRWKF